MGRGREKKTGKEIVFKNQQILQKSRGIDCREEVFSARRSRRE